MIVNPEVVDICTS